jgi:hypothetical protein
LCRVKEAVSKVRVPEFVPKQGVKIVTDEKATSMAQPMDDDSVIDQLLEKLEAGSASLPKDFKMAPITFEKVSDRTLHPPFGSGDEPSCLCVVLFRVWSSLRGKRLEGGIQRERLKAAFPFGKRA